LLAALTVFYILMGCFFDDISIPILTTAIILSMAIAVVILLMFPEIATYLPLKMQDG